MATVQLNRRASRAPVPPDTAALVELLTDLYTRQRQTVPPRYGQYFGDHDNPRSILGRVLTFQWYSPHLPQEGAILEWGCMHAPDSCLIRRVCAERLQLHGCDFRSPEEFNTFDEYSRINYVQLRHPVQLPYGEDAFESIVAAGCLEHVAMDYESLKELYRVLKPGGSLIITYLPNRWSYREFYNRAIRRSGFHRRIYGGDGISDLLKRSGFLPQCVRPMSFFLEWQLRRLFGQGRATDLLRRALFTLVPVHHLASTHCAIARKVLMM